MGQNASVPTNIIPDAYDSVQFEVKKQAQIFSEIGSLSYEDFQKCLTDLNNLSRKCLDPTGKQLVFAVKKGSDSTLLWKGTVRIACVKVDPQTKKVDCYKLLNLKQFLQVFRTFQTNLHAMITVESQRISPTSSPSNSSGCFNRNGPTASILMEHVNAIDNQPTEGNECCICLERKPEVSLPCAHIYCYPCIEQWNIHSKTCPICDEVLSSTSETWVLTEMPEVDEVSEEICSTLMKLSKDDKKHCAEIIIQVGYTYQPPNDKFRNINIKT